MGKYLVKLIGSGIGLASEALSSARNKSAEYTSHDDHSPSRNLTMDQSHEFVFADANTAEALVVQGYAELPTPAEQDIYEQYAELAADTEIAHYKNTDLSVVPENEQGESTEAHAATIEKETSPAPGIRHNWDAYSESNYSVNLERQIDQTEAAWRMDETSYHDSPPSYEESEFPPGVAYENEPNQAQKMSVPREHVPITGTVQYMQPIHVDVNQPASHPSNAAQYPHNSIDAPKVAPLVFSDLDQEAKYIRCAPVTPQPNHTELVSSHQNERHPCCNGKLISVLTGGRIGNKPGLIERAANSIKKSENTNSTVISGMTKGALGSEPSLVERAATYVQESQRAKRIPRCEAQCRIKEQWQRHRNM
ncbi:hypothetical protein PENANT_c008G08881 [Penicillium antarcticum]|uniref:Uncharacterized protein n=1 Tax=Penicillium antarcticum TaxID=416450 RepID=A0A1V6QB61_9EURO|nr:uncharacterized protein N7508_007255 [Penicillium antarcticum]KAJ5302392.1 hypothetical protein N7508_007255 [Penicillium antarcticum]OQD86237.1 hypothetical protein PENANT_c008G08881 [Penicillium antarcticum]